MEARAAQGSEVDQIAHEEVRKVHAGHENDQAYYVHSLRAGAHGYAHAATHAAHVGAAHVFVAQTGQEPSLGCAWIPCEGLENEHAAQSLRSDMSVPGEELGVCAHRVVCENSREQVVLLGELQRLQQRLGGGGASYCCSRSQNASAYKQQERGKAQEL